MRILQYVVVRALVVTACVALLAEAAAARNTNGTWRTFGGAVNPPARKHHTMVYDANSKRVVLYGGENHNAQEQDQALGDVWVFSVECPGWQQLTPSPDPVHGTPAARHGHAAAYVGGASPRMVIYGGREGFETQNEVFLTDTWSLSLTGTPTWQRLTVDLPSGPGGCSEGDFLHRTHATLTGLGNSVFLFGGRADDGAPMQDFWQLNLTTNTWSWVSGATSDAVEDDECDFPNLPEHRYWHSADKDSWGRIVVFGGVYRDDPISTAWAFGGAGTPWNKVGHAPTSPINMSRNFHVGVCDIPGNRLLMHGGYTSSGENGITNVVTTLNLPNPTIVLPPWQNATWTTLSPSGTNPGYFAEHAGVFVAFRDWMVVFGGVDENDDLRSNTTHILDFADSPDVTAPAAATLTGRTGRTTAVVEWTSPGDDGSTGTACRYELRKSNSQITEGNFASATLIPTSPPYAAGNAECAEINGNTACQTRYYGLKTFDDAGNASSLTTITLTQKCNYTEVMCEGGLVTGVLVPAPVTLEYRITGANPASGHTSLEFAVPADFAGQSLEITVYDVAGRRVRTLEQRLATAGTFNTSWDHRSGDGREVAVGMYFAKLTVGSRSITQKILVAPSR